MSRPATVESVTASLMALAGTGRRWPNRRALAVEIAATTGMHFRPVERAIEATPALGRTALRIAPRPRTALGAIALRTPSDQGECTDQLPSNCPPTALAPRTALELPSQLSLELPSDAKAQVDATAAELPSNCPRRGDTSLSTTLALLLDRGALTSGKYTRWRANRYATTCVACGVPVARGAGRSYWPFDGESERCPTFCVGLSDEAHEDLMIAALVEEAL